MQRYVRIVPRIKSAFFLLAIMAFPVLGLTGPAVSAKAPKPAKNPYVTYWNERYGFSMDVPSDFIDQGTSGSGDGNIFISKDKKSELRVWGGYNALEETPRETMERNMAEEKDAVYTLKTATKTWYVLSWTVKGKIVYQKELMSREYVAGFRLEYPKTQKSRFDPIIAHMVRTLALPMNE